MQDPLGSYNEIERRFRLYIRTAFGTQYPEIEEERDSLCLLYTSPSPRDS